MFVEVLCTSARYADRDTIRRAVSGGVSMT
jgi:hypothetical protein